MSLASPLLSQSSIGEKDTEALTRRLGVLLHGDGFFRGEDDPWLFGLVRREELSARRKRGCASRTHELGALSSRTVR